MTNLRNIGDQTSRRPILQDGDPHRPPSGNHKYIMLLILLGLCIMCMWAVFPNLRRHLMSPSSWSKWLGSVIGPDRTSASVILPLGQLDKSQPYMKIVHLASSLKDIGNIEVRKTCKTAHIRTRSEYISP